MRLYFIEKSQKCALSVGAAKVIVVNYQKGSGEFTFLHYQNHFYVKNGLKLQIARKFLNKKNSLKKDFSSAILLPFKTRYLPDTLKNLFGNT